MVAPYPTPDGSRIDEKAEREMALVKEVVNAARNLRSTMKLSPAASVPLYVAERPRSLPANTPPGSRASRASPRCASSTRFPPRTLP